MILENIRLRASYNPKHIVLPEGDDPRTIVAAARCAAEKIARVTLLGQDDEIRKTAELQGANLNGVNIVNPESSPNFQKFVLLFHELRRAKGITLEEAEAIVRDPLFFGALMVRNGDADGSVAGANNSTSKVVRAALQCVGAKQGFRTVSSFFLMVVPNKAFGYEGAMVFSDCGVVINPDAQQLAEIAISAADSFQALVGAEPRVAMLSFSTKGSAHHEMTEKVIEATKTVKARAPELLIDGELQADAAIMPSVAAKKAEGSIIGGNANVLIFPDLNSGNIAYKLTERLAGGEAIGPILQGLDKPCNDLSRGCTTEDILNAVAITAVQAQSSS